MQVLSQTQNPKLRALDIRRHTQNGREYIMLRDPLQLSDKLLLVPQPLAAVLAFCDGQYSANGMAQAFQAHYGFQIGADTVEQLLLALDEAYLLDNPRAEAAYEEARQVYRAARCRPPLLAGQSYPDDADELHAMLEAYLAEATPPRPAQPIPSLTPAHSFGLLSPHIDYARGGHVYAQVWQQAAPTLADADLAIIFGTDHYGTDTFTLTRQHYATPYGVLPTAFDIVDRLAETIGPSAAFAGELRHRGEHSLELVAVWLHHMRRRSGITKPIEIVPILCGGLYPHIYGESDPAQDALLNRVVATLRQETAGRRVVVIASGDLAHVGSAFGQEPLDATRRAAVLAEDEKLLAHLSRGNATGFFEAIRAVRDGNNVCGVTPIYLTLQMLGDVVGIPAGYDVCPADDTNTSVVTVGGMVFHSEQR